MQTWWEALSTIEKVFWLMSIPFSVIFVIQMVLSFIGIGGGATDPGADFSGMNSDIGHDGHNLSHGNEDAGPGFLNFRKSVSG